MFRLNNAEMVDTAPTFTISGHAGMTPSLLQPAAAREHSSHEGLEVWLHATRLLTFPTILRVGSLGVVTKAARKNALNHGVADVAIAIVVVVAVVVADAADPSRRFHRRRRAARGRAP